MSSHCGGLEPDTASDEGDERGCESRWHEAVQFEQDVWNMFELRQDQVLVLVFVFGVLVGQDQVLVEAI